MDVSMDIQVQSVVMDMVAKFRIHVKPREYDAIRDAISTCARKPTCVSLICRTETTTKKCKTEKPKRCRVCVCIVT